MILLCWTAQQRKPQSQSKNQGRLNLSLPLQDQQGPGRKRMEVSAMEDVTGSQEEIRDGYKGDLSGTCSREVMAASTGTAGNIQDMRGHTAETSTCLKNACLQRGCWPAPSLRGANIHSAGCTSFWQEISGITLVSVEEETHPSSVGRTGSTAQEMGWRSHPSGFGGGCVFVGGENLSSFLQTGRSPLRCGI